METPYRLYHQSVAITADSLAPHRVVILKHQFRPMVWKESRPAHRTRSFRYAVLFLLFTACLSGISLTAAAGYVLLSSLR